MISELVLQQRLANRSKHFGIEIRKDARVIYEKGLPQDLTQYSDPVNLFYPTHNLKSAVLSAKQFLSDQNEIYEKFVSVNEVKRRLYQGLRRYGVVVEKVGQLIKRFEDGIELIKLSDEWRIAAGILYTAKSEVDAQGHFVSPDVLRKASFEFMKNLNISSGAGVMHREFDRDVSIVGFWFTPFEMVIKTDVGDKIIPPYSALMMQHYKDPETWQKVKSGEYNGFSLGGYGRLKRIDNA